MAGFVGSMVIVTLKQGAVVQGFVQAVDPASASLALQDGNAMTRQLCTTIILTTPSIPPKHWPAASYIHGTRSCNCRSAGRRGPTGARGVAAPRRRFDYYTTFREHV